MRIHEGMIHWKERSEEITCFIVLDFFVWGLEASPVAKTSFMEDSKTWIWKKSDNICNILRYELLGSGTGSGSAVKPMRIHNTGCAPFRPSIERRRKRWIALIQVNWPIYQVSIPRRRFSLCPFVKFVCLYFPAVFFSLIPYTRNYPVLSWPSATSRIAPWLAVASNLHTMANSVLSNTRKNGS